MPNPVVEIIINKNNSYATGMYFDDGSIKIYRGSKASPFPNYLNLSKSNLEWRKLLENEYLDTNKVFVKDCMFPNYSTCVSAVIGTNHNATGINVISGGTLFDYLNNEERGPLYFSITCRPDAYDVEGAFNNLDSIWWRQSVSRIRKGDIVYIYVAKPIQSYVYKCVVLQTDVPEDKADIAKDAMYILDIAALPEKRNYMELKLVEKGDLPVEIIEKEADFNSFALRKQFLLSSEVVTVFDKHFKIKPSLADLDDKETPVYDYAPTRDNVVPKTVTGEATRFVRSAYERKRAIELSNKKCQMPGCTHELFLDKNGNPYLEVHHIIPMNAQGDFQKSIDIVENMVCLCPSCHREIHNGKNSRDKIIEVFNSRNKALSSKGIILEIESLLAYYGIK